MLRPKQNRHRALVLINKGISYGKNVDEFIRYYATPLTHNNIIPISLDQRLADEESGKEMPIEIGSA